jgi:hypothetical protein
MQYNHEADERFLFAMSMLAEACGVEATTMKIKVYAQGLDDIPVNDIENACRQIIRTRTTASFPKVAEIRETIHGKATDKAVLAALTIEKATSKGSYCSIVFEDPYIHATINALGGWEHICDISAMPDEWKFFKKDIERTYAAMIAKPLASDVPLRLSGYYERTNSSAGFDLNKHRPKVEYVGDLLKIEQWRSQVKQLQGQLTNTQISHEDSEMLSIEDVKQLIVGIGGLGDNGK